MPTFNKDLMRATIMTHYEKPYHKKTPQNADEYMHIHLNSASCIDDITLYLKVENGKVVESFFDGIGCAISISSTSILMEMIENKSIDDVLVLIDEYHKMLNEEDFNEELLNEAIALQNTARQPSRIKCALIGWDGVRDLINTHQKESK